MNAKNVAILGATGAVGTELIGILTERKFPIQKLRLLASKRSAGRRVTVAGTDYLVEEVSSDSFSGVDIAFFSAGGEVSQRYAAAAAAAGAVVIDNTSAFRLHPDVPLVVPEVNSAEIWRHQGIIANPNCSTILMAVVLKPIYDAVGIRRVVVSTYQAVSGAGAKGMEELDGQIRAYVAGEPCSAQVMPYPIAFNAIPHIDVFEADDYTKEEWKMVRETQKIFADKNLKISATAVRLPIMRSHCESINVEVRTPLSATACRELLDRAEGVRVVDDVKNCQYPMPVDSSGKDSVHVGRIRRDTTVEHGINLWLCGDQIRKGAALNAVQIAERLCQQKG